MEVSKFAEMAFPLYKKKLIMPFYVSFPFNFNCCVGFNDAVLTRQCTTSELSRSFSVF